MSLGWSQQTVEAMTWKQTEERQKTKIRLGQFYRPPAIIYC
jgi:hypothetical protein